VIVDDGSTDGTRLLYDAVRTDDGSRTPRPTQPGQGRRDPDAAELATGDYLIICDADLEYAPAEIPGCSPDPARRGDGGLRHPDVHSHNSYSYFYVLGNRGVTTAANVLFNCYISDLETCFKLLPVSCTAAGHPVGRLRHGGRSPASCCAAAAALRDPDHYRRAAQEAKKLTWRDGVEALWILIRERFRPVSSDRFAVRRHICGSDGQKRS